MPMHWPRDLRSAAPTPGTRAAARRRPAAPRPSPGADWPERLAALHGLGERRQAGNGRHHARHRDGHDRVDGDVRREHIPSPRSAPCRDAGLGRGVVALSEIAALAGDGRHQHDAAAFALLRACARTAARAQVKVPRKCVSTTASKSSSDMFQSTRSRRMPALVHRMSRRPNDSTARATRRSAASAVPTATTSATAGRPSAAIAGHRLVGGVGVDIVHDHRGAGLGERLREREAEPAPAAGDDRHLAVRADRCFIAFVSCRSAAREARLPLFHEGPRSFARVFATPSRCAWLSFSSR